MLIQSARTHILRSIWYHMRVREDCSFWFFNEISHFFSRYLVVGTIFFFGFNNMRRNTRRSDFVQYQAKTWKQPCVAFRGQSDAAVRQIASMNDSYGYTVVNCVRHTTVVSQSWLASFVTNSQLTQADEVFKYTSDRSRSICYVDDNLDPNLPFWCACLLYTSDAADE